jgi:hypothetical protein
VIGDPIETSACTHADVPDLIDRTRQAVLANFHPEYPARS